MIWFICLVLFIPFLKQYVKLLNTFVHELGHSFMALLLKGKVKRIHLHANTGGDVITYSRGRFSDILITLSGYPFEAIVGSGIMFAVLNGQSIYVFWALSTLLVLSLVLWIRNLYGMLWVISVLACISILIYFGLTNYVSGLMLAAAVIIVSEAWISSFGIMKMAFKTPKNAGDATSLKELTWISARFWGLGFFIFNTYVFYETIMFYLTHKAL
ncbi:M50 family metallopeptidase (plasmid) [Pontibacillus sp. ALD_SL1]|uniref:M50 family metallopeptidase n=1 Tax=Pontibacillus sp. ALD_SL1 TaxID=2777185 RepID=UPI001A959621|nr:M50 family metallopeptidase [Pontibacillus sp. ALD_SL1]QST02067.1 M50 family metallopeptidase [Pontibacillus sp. ALD_SL1]